MQLIIIHIHNKLYIKYNINITFVLEICQSSRDGKFGKINQRKLGRYKFDYFNCTINISRLMTSFAL